MSIASDQKIKTLEANVRSLTELTHSLAELSRELSERLEARLVKLEAVPIMGLTMPKDFESKTLTLKDKSWKTAS